jgi:hypothetical protein
MSNFLRALEKVAANVRITDSQSGNDSIKRAEWRALLTKLQQYVLWGIVLPAALLPEAWP